MVLRTVGGAEVLCRDIRVEYDDELPMQWCSLIDSDVRVAPARDGDAMDAGAAAIPFVSCSRLILLGA